MSQRVGTVLSRVGAVAVLVAIMTSLMQPMVSAAPPTLPGSGSASSPGSADGAPGTTANGYYEVDRVFLKDWYGDTTWRAQFVAGKCLEEADSTHFVTERSAPWESCFYENSVAVYDYIVTGPTGQIAVSRVQYTKPPAFPVSVTCVMGAARCEAYGTSVLEFPEVNLRPPLHYFGDAVGNTYYCTAEGYSCTVPDNLGYGGGNFTATYGVRWAESFDSANYIEQRKYVVVRDGVPRASDLKFQCEQQFFGTTVDPAPGRLKACYVSNFQPTG
jgi:hypothetical protein